MAINTTGNNGSVVGVTGVHPDNMGKGIKYNNTSKKYEVAISNEPNNLLRLIDDGVYYGIQAKANIANLYVDAINGIDQDPNKVIGAGTRANPLKTIKYAVLLAERGTTRVIHLKELQEHVLDANDYFEVPEGRLYFTSYGEQRDAIWNSNSVSDSFQLINQVDIQNKNAIIVFKGIRTSLFPPNPNITTKFNVFNTPCIGIQSNTLVDFNSCHFVNDLDFTMNFTENNTASTMGTQQTGRIYVNNTGELSIICCKFSERGSIKFNNPFNVEFDTNEKKEAHFMKPNSSGLYECAMIGASSNFNGTIYLYRTERNFNLRNMLFGRNYWSATNLKKPSYNFSSLENTLITKENLIKHTHHFRKEVQSNGTKLLVSPISNLLNSYFFA